MYEEGIKSEQYFITQYVEILLDNNDVDNEAIFDNLRNCRKLLLDMILKTRGWDNE